MCVRNDMRNAHVPNGCQGPLAVVEIQCVHLQNTKHTEGRDTGAKIQKELARTCTPALVLLGELRSEKVVLAMTTIVTMFQVHSLIQDNVSENNVDCNLGGSGRGRSDSVNQYKRGSEHKSEMQVSIFTKGSCQ